MHNLYDANNSTVHIQFSLNRFIILTHGNLHYEKREICHGKLFLIVSFRVNLIGEHVDYCGYAVHPMAVEQDILIAVSTTNSNTLNICNIEEIMYPAYTCDINKFEYVTVASAWLLIYFTVCTVVVERHYHTPGHRLTLRTLSQSADLWNQCSRRGVL